MRKLITLVCLLLMAVTGRAQVNHVPNGSFEQYTLCPGTLSQITNAIGWYSYNGGTPDYFHTCAIPIIGFPIVSVPNNFGGSEPAAQGNAYIGAYTDAIYRELAACAITPLVVGAIYEVSMSVSKAETYPGNTNDLGVYFFENGVTSFNGQGTITATPQISYSSYGVISQTNGWIRLTKTFVADSPYHHMAVGCFSPSVPLTPSGTAYYYMDSIVVKRLHIITIGTPPSTVLCRGDVVQIPFTVISPGNYYQPSNVFTLQLSDATGSFTNATNIGTLAGNTSGTITGTIPMLLPAGTGYKLRIKSSNVVDSSLGSIDLSIVNVVPAKPIAVANTPLCSGSGSLNLAATTSTPGVTWSWTGPSGFVSTLQNPSINTPGTLQSGNYVVEANIFACKSEKDTITVVVNETPSPIVASSNSPVCAPNALQLSATNTLSGATYHWSGVAGYTSTQQNPVITPSSAAHSGTYTVYASRNGCSTPAETISVTVHPLPYLGAYASPNDTVCDGTVVTFVTVPMNGIQNPQFQWFKNGVEVPGQTSLTYIGAYATGDTFYCRTYAQDLCNNNITLYSNKVGMVVQPIVNNLSASISSTPAIPQPGQPINFKCDVVSGGYTPQFQWRKNGNDILGAIHANWSANNLAPYDEITCHVTSSDPCAAPKETVAAKVVVNFPTSVGGMQADNDIAIYPNPNSGNFTIKSNKHRITAIEVLNSVGQKVYSLSTDGNKLSISLPASLANGIYTLKLSTEAGMHQQRITLQR